MQKIQINLYWILCPQSAWNTKNGQSPTHWALTSLFKRKPLMLLIFQSFCGKFILWKIQEQKIYIKKKFKKDVIDFLRYEGKKRKKEIFALADAVKCLALLVVNLKKISLYKCHLWTPFFKMLNVRDESFFQPLSFNVFLMFHKIEILTKYIVICILFLNHKIAVFGGLIWTCLCTI